MTNFKNFLAVLLLLMTTFSYAQIPKPAYVGSKSYSAKGSGSSGNIGTISYTIPTGVTNKNRVMIITFAGERYNPGPGTNFFRILTNDYWDAQTIWGMNVNGNPVTYSCGWHVNYNGSNGIINTYQTWKGVAYAYTMPDNMTGTVPITFSNFRNPGTNNDEIACVVSVYENVKSVELYSGTNITSFGSLYTGSAQTAPAGRTAQDIMYMINGATTHETNLTLSSGWTTDQFVKVQNVTSTASDGFSTNEHDGIAHIIGHRNGFSGTVSGGITKASTVANTQDLSVFHALFPFISPTVTGKVVTPTLSSGTATDGGGGLYVNVVDKSTGKVVAVATVDASGNFSIPAGNVMETMNYDYILSKNAGTVGATAPVVALNTGWTNVKEGAGPYDASDATPDGIFNMTMTGTNVNAMRFAISPTVDAVDDTYTNVAPGSTTASVIANDLLNGSPAVIGSTAGTVSISTATDAAGTSGAWPAGFTLNADGTIAVGATVATGSYTLYYNICAQTAGSPCDVAKVSITVGALSVSFGTLNADISGGKLSVNWTSLTETNNDHYEIEASTDGTNFTKIGAVVSKATNGNSGEVISYTFSKDASSAAAVLGFSLLAIGGLGLGFKRNRKLIFGLVMLAGMAAAYAGCTKNDAGQANQDGKLFIRIAQVDKDGTKQYSKTIQAVKK